MTKTPSKSPKIKPVFHDSLRERKKSEMEGVLKSAILRAMAPQAKTRDISSPVATIITENMASRFIVAANLIIKNEPAKSAIKSRLLSRMERCARSVRNFTANDQKGGCSVGSLSTDVRFLFQLLRRFVHSLFAILSTEGKDRSSD